MRETIIRDIMIINDFKNIDLGRAVVLERLVIEWDKLYAKKGILIKRENPNLIDIADCSLNNEEAYKKILEQHPAEKYDPAKYDSTKTIMKTLQTLKENYHRVGEYDSEDSAFVEYMRVKAAKPKKSSSGNKERIEKKMERFGFKALDLIGEYGTNVSRIFSFLIAVPLLMSIFIFIANWVADPFSLSMIWGSLQSSYEAFLTFGIITADTDNGMIRTICYICGYMGLFFMAYFVVAVARRTLR